MSGKSTKKAGAAGVDIRSFFGGGSNQTKVVSQTTSSSQSQKTLNVAGSSLKRKAENADADDTPPKKKSSAAKAIDISDDDERPRREVNKPTTIVLSDANDTPPPPKKAPVKEIKRKKSSAFLSSDDDELAPPPKRKPSTKLKKRASSDQDEPPKKKKAPTKSNKANALISSDEDVPPKKTKMPTKAAPRKSAVKKEEDYSMASGDEDADDDLVPNKSKKPAPKKKEKVPAKDTKDTGEDKPKKFNYYAHQAAKKAVPTNYGGKELPEGSPNCLAGLSFVFTGELASFSRDEATGAAKRFGGRVVGQPSSRTDYIILGDNAGPAKLAAIKKHGIKTLNEDEFLELIKTRTGTGEIDEKTKKKMEKEHEAIKKEAKEMEKREKREIKEVERSGAKGQDPGSQLWTTKYAPQSLKEVCGNKAQVDKLLLWLQEWPASYKADFKKPGKFAMNSSRAVLITGSPGIGKTTSAHLCAKLAGYTPVELNASDARSKKLVENGMNINNTSLDGYIGGGQTNSLGVTITDRTCLIMDEVDGMSSGDRGGVGALNAMIKKTKIPIICIANDKGAQKLKPLQATTFGMPFTKPQAAQVRSRLLTIAYKEKMELNANVVDQLVSGSQSDIRQVLNMLSTWKLSNRTMNFDEGKVLTKMNEKYHIMSPFDITSTILGPYFFSPNEKKTLGDKMELYFQDHSFVPLFIQENYLKATPTKIRNLEGPEKVLKQLQLMDRAASSISDGDLVDNMIHGPEQHWSLMPLHAVCSTVRPSSFVYGQGVHYGGTNGISFPHWLGQNSKQTKLSRQLGDIQIKMRLKVSGDKYEVRQHYIPALYPHIVRPLMDEGASAIDAVIDHMDTYYLSKDDWDSMVELGVDIYKDELVMKKIPAAVKSAFTRKYNSGEHPIAYHKAMDTGKVPKKLVTAGEKPDLEDAFDMDEDVVGDDDDEDSSKESPKDQLAGDKMVKQKGAKKKAAPRKSAAQ